MQEISESHSVVSDSLLPHGPYSMELSSPEYWSGQLFPPPGDPPNPGIEPRSPILQADSLPAETQGKPKNTGVGSLSLLQGLLPTQGLNPGLLCCRQILYQLSYQGSPKQAQIIKLFLWIRSLGMAQLGDSNSESCEVAVKLLTDRGCQHSEGLIGAGESFQDSLFTRLLAEGLSLGCSPCGLLQRVT